MEEFSDECLKISGVKLSCSACRVKKSSPTNLKVRIKMHTTSAKHEQNKLKFSRATKDNAHLSFQDKAFFLPTRSLFERDGFT